MIAACRTRTVTASRSTWLSRRFGCECGRRGKEASTGVITPDPRSDRPPPHRIFVVGLPLILDEDTHPLGRHKGEFAFWTFVLEGVWLLSGFYVLLPQGAWGFAPGTAGRTVDAAQTGVDDCPIKGCVGGLTARVGGGGGGGFVPGPPPPPPPPPPRFTEAAIGIWTPIYAFLIFSIFRSKFKAYRKKMEERRERERVRQLMVRRGPLHGVLRT